MFLGFQGMRKSCLFVLINHEEHEEHEGKIIVIYRLSVLRTELGFDLQDKGRSIRTGVKNKV